MRYPSLLSVLMIAAVTVVVGCGGSERPNDFPKLYPCSVVVKNGDEPLADAVVSLSVPNATSSHSSYGHTDSSGFAKIVTMQGTYSQNGAPEGEYVVVIQKEPNLPYDKTDKEMQEMSLDDFEAYNRVHAKKLAALPKIVPVKLTTPSQSPLKITVTPQGGELTIDIAKEK